MAPCMRSSIITGMAHSSRCEDQVELNLRHARDGSKILFGNRQHHRKQGPQALKV